MKITDVPFVDPTGRRDYRLYKIKFQAPPGTGLFTWRAIVVSDTYIGEDAAKDLQVCFLHSRCSSFALTHAQPSYVWKNSRR
jgi:hypothetical protein